MLNYQTLDHYLDTYLFLTYTELWDLVVIPLYWMDCCIYAARFVLEYFVSSQAYLWCLLTAIYLCGYVIGSTSFCPELLIMSTYTCDEPRDQDVYGLRCGRCGGWWGWGSGRGSESQYHHNVTYAKSPVTCQLGHHRLSAG
ncbi:hypothetical protein K466DRAFT_582402 [Polyporus arcularius HHB13444]|uniref:Uncharacterized protein n=1 Tax=Polyporus arcularius HHB13444 TaxID=1314778 RepID=A0A5C3PR05_9APHY|nr:hypothetical protein K466DRAFT_582402 [Polyporus arcularius HHB13444]